MAGYQIRVDASSKPINANELARQKIAEGLDVPAAMETLDALFLKKRETPQEWASAVGVVANILSIPGDARGSVSFLSGVLLQMRAILRRKKIIDEKSIAEGTPVVYAGRKCTVLRITKDYRILLRFLDGSTKTIHPIVLT